MQGYALNVSLVSNRKFTKETIDEIKISMESKEDFIAFYSIFSEFMQLTFNNCLEIYVEDFFLETDLQNDLKPMIKDLDSMIPGGLANDSKLEWSSDISPATVIWYKDEGNWIETVSDSNADFLEDWVEEDYENDPYENGYSDNFEDDDNW